MSEVGPIIGQVKSTTDLIVEITTKMERNTRLMEAIVSELEARGELTRQEGPSLELVPDPDNNDA